MKLFSKVSWSTAKVCSVLFLLSVLTFIYMYFILWLINRLCYPYTVKVPYEKDRIFNWSLNLSLNDLIKNVISYSNSKLNPWTNISKEVADLSVCTALFVGNFQWLNHSASAKNSKSRFSIDKLIRMVWCPEYWVISQCSIFVGLKLSLPTF